MLSKQTTTNSVNQPSIQMSSIGESVSQEEAIIRASFPISVPSSLPQGTTLNEARISADGAMVGLLYNSRLLEPLNLYADPIDIAIFQIKEDVISSPPAFLPKGYDRIDCQWEPGFRTAAVEATIRARTAPVVVEWKEMLDICEPLDSRTLEDSELYGGADTCVESRVIVTLAVLLLVMLPVMLPAHLTVAQETAAVDNFTIYISSAGENGTAGNLTLGPITQGDTVIITFVWTDFNNPFNNHQMEIDGYNVTTDVLSQQTPTSVVQFTVDKAGTFRIYCIIPCLGMDNMQNGWLVVKPVTTSTTSSSSNTSTTSSSGTTSTVTTTSTSSSRL